MTQAEQARVRDFSQKMRDQGSDGFADGPWDDAEIEGDNHLSARQRLQRNWLTNASRHTRQRTLGDRVLTWVTILTLIALVAGIAGAWLSYQPEPGNMATDKTPGVARVEARLTRMEKRLSRILDPYIRMLNNLSGKLDDTQQQLLEHRQNTGQQPALTTGLEARLDTVEQRLVAADKRMDTLSGVLIVLADSKPGSVPGTEPPAASATPTAAGTPGTGKVARTAALPVQNNTSGLQPVAAPEPEPEPVPENPVPVAQQPAATDPAGSKVEVAEPPAANVTEPVPETTPEPAAPVAEQSATGTAEGNWVINIASYTNANIARRKLAQMQQQGVDVELVTAEVNGKTIYRARVFGFASRRDATSAATEIQSKLGLEETWITKR